MNRRSSPYGLFFLLIACCLVLVILLGYISCMSCKSCRQEKEEDYQQHVYQPTQAQQKPTVRVTFPEGKNVMQIGEMLENNGVCTAVEFYTAMNTNDYSADYPFLPSFDKLADRPYKLEGYLYPDTYDFYLPESADSVVRRFLNNFQSKISDELVASAASTGDFYNQKFDFDDIVTMASIVEREVNGLPEEDMKKVAAVFYNRMKYPGGTVDGSATGGFFQSDATKFYPYVMETVPEDFTSDYNTFKVKGLPKGPICCPSISAIRASAAPDHNEDAFFFYTDKNKKVYYAVTFEQHQANYRYCKENGLAPW